MPGKNELALPGALIASVVEQSPADDAGFVSGCRVMTVDGHPLRDMIDWSWYSADDLIVVEYVDTEGDSGVIELQRSPGEEWGFTFEGLIFDQIKTCRNACTFCFMRQLPDKVRDTLVLRDDDFRLSFFEGTFVTFTNVTPEDEARIIEQRISPLRMSLHAITPEIRKDLIGAHEAQGVKVCERLLEAGIELHVQIVLVPGVNDAEELKRSLDWAYARKNITRIGVVPLGFTKHQTMFDHSYNDPSAAQEVLEAIAPFQKRARAERGFPWVYAADEFYRNAYPDDLLDMLPAAEHYGGFEMFEDGIGIIRSTVDSWTKSTEAIALLAKKLTALDRHVHYVIGCAQREFLIPLIDASPLKNLFVPLAVPNDYFGGNVDVTGLLCGCDIVRALNAALSQGEQIEHACLPRVIFNSDGLTLDDMSLEDMQRRTRVPLVVVSCDPSEYLDEIIALVH